MESIGERLKFARKRKGYTQNALAEEIGFSRCVIYNLEKNKTEPKALFINAISKVLEINKEWLINGTGDMEYKTEITRNRRILSELGEIAKELPEDEQIFLLDMAKSLRQLSDKRRKI